MASESQNNTQDFDHLFAKREQSDSTPDGGAATNSRSVDATCMYEEGATDKKERDVAFALAVLERNHLTERLLAGAIKDWTIHGTNPLASHLVNKQLIDSKIRTELDEAANDNLRTAAARASRGDGSPSSNETATYAELDPSGRIVRMLGLTMAPVLSLSERDRRVVSEYKLLRRLGQGGMGTVWLARDERLGRLVAIKEIRKHAIGNTLAAHRFRREAQVTGRLEHPSIVPVHQLGEHAESGRVFYVMRFIGKRTLEDAIAEYHERRDAGDVNPMHLHHLLTAFVTVCQAIAFANSRHVVHRDLKPENIALDDYGQVIVLDWGLAKLTGRGELQEIFGDIEQSDSSQDGSMAGQVLGTPMYMAPEQAAGRNEEIDQTTDVFGLGAILYSILTGYAPHERSHQSLTGSTKATELFQAIVSSPAPKAELANPDAPPELAAICAKAMANKRYARYANAMEIAEDVQRWMAGEPVSNFVEPWRKRARRWMGTHRRISQLTGVLLTVLLVMAIMLSITSQQNRLVDARNRFEGLKADGRELEVRLRGIADELTKDARFMASLPPIQEIIAARSETATSDPVDVWRGRLEMIYLGLLRSNPNHLSASYSSLVDNTLQDDDVAYETVKEIVHVKRQFAGDSVQIVPQSRLETWNAVGFLSTVFKLPPGDVLEHAATEFEQAEDASTATRAFVLAAGTPIYNDVDGEAFGIVTVETDLEMTIRNLLETTVDAGEEAYIVSDNGNVLLHYSHIHEFQSESVGREIGELVPSAKQFFVPGEKADQFSDGRQTYGLKVRIDPRHSSDYVGVVLTVNN